MKMDQVFIEMGKGWLVGLMVYSAFIIGILIWIYTIDYVEAFFNKIEKLVAYVWR